MTQTKVATFPSGQIMATVLSFVLCFMSLITITNLGNVWTAGLLALGVNGVLTLLGRTVLSNFFEEWWRSAVIANAFTVGCLISASASLDANVRIFGWYVIGLTLFHISEYLATAVTNPLNLSTDSFLLNHSPAYHLAAVASWLEFWFEWYFVPAVKSVFLVSYLGVVLCLGGEILRKWAMVQAGQSFNHLVQTDKKEDHKLVTEGIYAVVRHPSYVGWFYWSVGTQLILVNPLCLFAYTLMSWKFFQERVYAEECYLLRFFGQDYKNYMDKVPTGLPFIQGFQREVRD